MATHPVLTPGTQVDIIPLSSCNPEPVLGTIVESCLVACCDQTASEPWCEKYKVEYYVKGCCDRCDIKYHYFCRSELVEVLP